MKSAIAEPSPDSPANDTGTGSLEPPADQPHAGHLQVVRADPSEPLSRCVEDALRTYLKTTDGHEVRDLHRLVIEEVERPLFATVMRHTDGNLSRAADILGLTRSTLRRRLKDYAIDRNP